MKEDQPRLKNSSSKCNCPQCGSQISAGEVKNHILTCKRYVPTYVNNVRRFIDQLSPNYIEFLISEMDIIKEQLIKKAEESHEPLNNPYPSQPQNREKKQQKVSFQQNSKQRQPELKKSVDMPQQQQPKIEVKPPPRVVGIEQTLLLEDLYGANDPFQDPPISNESIECADPSCTRPVKMNDIERFTYLDECLHTICLYCFRNYVRNNYVKCKGELKCPNKKCKANILYIQIKQIVDPAVLNKLEEELNSKAFDLIQCQKCHEQYQFEKGKASDAPKKTQEGTALTAAMAKHYAENRFHCPKCKQQQCKNCKETPYHLGFNCEDFKEHKLKKKCRYCRKVLPKGYMNESGIHTFDDICSSRECQLQMKEACSKRLACGHSCGGMIKEKNCLPCLKEECAKKKADELHGQNENSYCSLCYIQALGQAPSIQSKCGHIFHIKCLRKRLELKWGTPRITFRFCQCPLCNKWMEMPEECNISQEIKKYKVLWQKIKQKAVKRLKHQKQDKDPKLTDPKSPYYQDETKYSMTIYAYFQCYECGQPYFGGRKSCAEAMNDAKQGQKFNPKELICPSCCPVQVTDCKKHGKEFISFKCRFCCSVAQWFCWGNTHFCDSCHKKQVSGQYISRLPKDKLPKCKGKEQCPVGGQHGGNGDQFCLGCGVCRGDRMQGLNF